MNFSQFKYLPNKNEKKILKNPKNNKNSPQISKYNHPNLSQFQIPNQKDNSQIHEFNSVFNKSNSHNNLLKNHIKEIYNSNHYF